MSTLVELRDRCQNALSDAAGATFTDALVTEWVEDAIREYSQHFGMVDIFTVTTADSTNVYGIIAASGHAPKSSHSVEYPVNQHPKEYLERRNRFDEGFYDDDLGYDIVSTGETPTRMTLYLSKRDFVALEQLFVYTYATYDEDAGTLEIPVEHEPIIIARVRWAAYAYLVAEEMKSPTNNSSLLMGQMQQNANSARKSYLQLLALVLLQSYGESRVVTWEMDKMDRIY